MAGQVLPFRPRKFLGAAMYPLCGGRPKSPSWGALGFGHVVSKILALLAASTKHIFGSQRDKGQCIVGVDIGLVDGIHKNFFYISIGSQGKSSKSTKIG